MESLLICMFLNLSLSNIPCSFAIACREEYEGMGKILACGWQVLGDGRERCRSKEKPLRLSNPRSLINGQILLANQMINGTKAEQCLAMAIWLKNLCLSIG